MERLRVKIRNNLQEITLQLDYFLFSMAHMFKKRPELSPPNEILVIEIAGMGDTISSTPVIRTLKQYYSQAKIDVLMSKITSPLLQNNPNINKIIPYTTYPLTLEQIKDKYNLAVLLAPGSREISKLLKNANIPIRTGCTKRGISQGKGFYLTRKAKPLKGITHTIDNNLNVLNTLGLITSNRIPELFTTKQEDIRIRALLRKYKIVNKDKIVILSPGSKDIESITYPSHLWPSENFARIGDFLINKEKVKIILLGKKEEIHLTEEIKNLMGESSLNLSGKLSLRQTMALIKRANLVIAVDSGLMHVAEAFNTPLISLFGPQNPKRWKPLSKSSITLYNERVCTGCQRYYCFRRDNICMKSITPEDVMESINKITF